MASPTQMQCYLVNRGADGAIEAGVARMPLDQLPAGDVLIRVEFSSLNYKDALAATGHPGVVKQFPHIPGVDAAGKVAESGDSRFRKGDKVLVTGYGLGADRWGGFADYIRVPADWVVPLPAHLDLRDSMVYGTAGFTAAQSLDAIIRHPVNPDDGPVVVTGASGGVGCLAVGLLSRAGYEVVASTGKKDAHGMLKGLGAEKVVGRDDVIDDTDKPLSKARWAAAVDTVGGNTLASIIRATSRGGCVTACGLVGGVELPLTVYPFILRGVTLVGIDSAECPQETRRRLWQELARDWRPKELYRVGRTVELDGLPKRIDEILAGRAIGRTVVELV